MLRYDITRSIRGNCLIFNKKVPSDCNNKELFTIFATDMGLFIFIFGFLGCMAQMFQDGNNNK